MRRVHLAALLAGALAYGCGGSAPAGDGAGAGSGTTAGPDGADAAAAPAVAEKAAPVASGADRPLAEFEPVSAADVALYLKVMRAAAERVRTLSPADRQALTTMREMTGRTMASTQMPSPEQLAAIQRAGELMTLDATVAREQGVADRFSSVQHRVDRFLHPMTGASSGDEDEQMTAERRAWVQDRIRRFRALDAQDAATLAPHRAELLALEKQVQALRSGSVPE